MYCRLLSFPLFIKINLSKFSHLFLSVKVIETNLIEVVYLLIQFGLYWQIKFL